MNLTSQLICTCLTFILSGYILSAQSTISGKVMETEELPVVFANVALYDTATSELVKVETTDLDGLFSFKEVPNAIYNLEITFIGLSAINQVVNASNQSNIELGELYMTTEGIELVETVVTAQRVMVEVKPDRTVFNVDGTVNSAGSDAIELLRKAPGVTVDNNNSINVLGRAGVLLYVDGKRLPLEGQDLTTYLQNLPAEQIDKIDIISNPGAKYEAEGNAGIIDIRLKKSDSVGGNGSISSTLTRGRHTRGNLNLNGNVRTGKVNVFGSAGLYKGRNYNEMDFLNDQNNLILDEEERSINDRDNFNFRGGVDYFLNKKTTLGVLVSANVGSSSSFSNTRINIATKPQLLTDSILLATNSANSETDQFTYNLNYGFVGDNNTTLNIDLDHGEYGTERTRFQPNTYFNAGEEEVLSEVINSFETPSDISISTAKIDYEFAGLGGTLGVGSKLSRVASDNTFLFNNVVNDRVIQNDFKSNIFKYDERVYAGYLSYVRSLSEKVSLSMGLRAEQTDANGDLQTFVEGLSEPPVELNYLSWFPNAGITWQVTPTNTLNLNYGRRINRPDYGILNPFNFQTSEISFQKGNPFLRPEIVNNLELGYTLNYRYNFKLSYSLTSDQITRLIAPDDVDPRGNFITWENLAKQTVVGFNASAPIDITEKWNAYINFSASYLNNQADYGDGAVVDVQAFTYNIFQQHTISLPGGFKGEVSGYFSGPGVWGGVFEYDTMYSLNIGAQKKFLNDKLNVRLIVNDIFYQSGWSGESSFNGLISTGRGNWDSRNATLSLSYNFGNQKIKSRNRKTGIEDEAGRVN